MEKDTLNYCFICGIDNDEFERKANVGTCILYLIKIIYLLGL